MLLRLLPILLVTVAAVDVEDAPAPSAVDERPREERADGQLPQRRPRPRPGGGSGFGSFLSGLLGSVTKTASVDSCPGKCIHALASLICDEVLEDVECPTANMRCCVEKGNGMPPPPRENGVSLGGLDLGLEMPPRPNESDKNASEKKDDEDNSDEDSETTTKEEVEVSTKKKKQKKRKKNKKTTTTTTTTTTTEASTTTEKKKKTKGTTKKPKTTTEAEEEDEDYAGVCPGVCVADRISCFCEAILDIEDLCKPNLRCCVAKKIFDDEETPDELIIPKQDERCNEKGDKNKKESKEEEEEIMEAAETTTAVQIVKQEKPEKDKPGKKPSFDIPLEKRCRGTCVTGFFSLLCDEIDRNAICPGSGRCCITKAPPSTSKPRRPTTRSPIRKTTPRATRPPRPIPPRQNLLKCPGVCLPSTMKSLCSQPSIIVPVPTTCKKGTFCCDHKEPSNERTPPPPRRPLPPRREPIPSKPKPNGPDISSLLTTFGPLLLTGVTGNPETASQLMPFVKMLAPLLSRPQTEPERDSRPPFRPPPPTRQPTTTTTTTTTPKPTEKPDDRPECPGTCIAPYLSFTCFGNAQTTELFKCPKKGTICCSPKSKIKEHNEQRQKPRLDGIELMKNPGNPQFAIRRNDTQFFDNTYPFPTQQKHALEERPPSHIVTNKYVCGVKGTYRSGRVVGGEDAVPGEWCWQVALINSLNQYLCGGALIGTQWVLTAAHCVTNIVRAGDAIYVRVGDHDLTQKFGSPGAQTLRVATTYIHHNHNSQTLDNDIALLKLHGEADLKEGVCLVCLPARGTSQATGKKCTVTGYGYMGETGPIPLRIREARVPIVNDNECVRKINTVTEKIFILPASSFCAGGEKGHDACQGDGGGPLVCEDSGYNELTGLVSWGFGCGRKDVPGVYVKVSSFIGWINQIISVNNS